ncbi:MAG: hypothetical protein ACPGWR_09815 [Ardenticatenaceae bacterium]
MFHVYQFSYSANIRRLAVAALLSLLAFLVVRPLFAQGGHTFRLSPDPALTTSTNNTYFVYDASPGSVIQDTLLVVNPSSEQVKLSLYPADGVTASNGGIAIGTAIDETPTEAGSWLQLMASQVTVEPSEDPKKATTQPVSFNLTIPDNILPGEYAATIVAQPAETVESEGQEGPVGINFIPRSATTVLVTIPGPEPLSSQLEISSFQADTSSGRQVITAELQNTGNDGIDKTEGTLTIRDSAGALVQEIPVRLGYFLAGDHLTYRTTINPVLQAGEYNITLSLAYQDKNVEQTTSLSLADPVAVPTAAPNNQSSPKSPNPDNWLLILLSLVAGILLLLIILLTIYSIRQSRARQAINQRR